MDVDSQIYIADTNNHCIRKIDQNGMMRRVIGTGVYGYSGDVPFDFEQYPHIGPPKKQLFKTIPKLLHDILVIHVNSHQNEVCDDTCYEHLNKKVKH